MRRRAQPQCPARCLWRDKIGALRTKRYVAVPVAPIISMVGKKAGLDIQRLHVL